MLRLPGEDTLLMLVFTLGQTGALAVKRFLRGFVHDSDGKRGNKRHELFQILPESLRWIRGLLLADYLVLVAGQFVKCVMARVDYLVVDLGWVVHVFVWTAPYHIFGVEKLVGQLVPDIKLSVKP